MMKTSNFIFLIALAIFLFPACTQEESPEPVAAPEIPMQAMHSMPTDFLGASRTDTAQASSHGISYHNWIHAGLNLLAWHTAVVAHTAIPTAAFQLALNEKPVYIGNATFVWSYQYQSPSILGGDTYDIELTGRYINNAQDVEWSMKVSQLGGFSNFEWYKGIVSIDSREASFVVYHDPANPTAVLSIEFFANAAGTDFSLRYTNIDPASEDRGGYIEYRVESANRYNRAFDVNGGPNNPGEFIEIQWAEPGKEGRVKNPAHFQDNDWHCWDTNYIDTDC